MTERDDDHLARMRVEYGSVEKDGSGDLDADWLADGWVALLHNWLADAERAGVAEPNAMVVGTVDARGRPSTRSVLCKSVDDDGITFFTNYDSAKGEELAGTPCAGHCCNAALKASCIASSARSKPPSKRTSVARIRPASARYTAST